MKYKQLSDRLYLKNGVLLWKKSDDRTPQWNGRMANKTAGASGQIEINGETITTARAIWILEYGFIDDSCVIQRLDYKKGFLISNLECLLPSAANRKKIKVKGVYKSRDWWKAEICTTNGGRFFIGVFDDRETALQAYKITALNMGFIA